MADATKLPTLSEITFVQLSRPGAENPRLSAAISDVATTLKFELPLLGSDGTVIAEAMLIGIRNTLSYVETVYIPAGGLSADGLTATGCVRGIDLDGLDWTVGDSSLAVEHAAGDAVFCNISGVIGALYTAAINGTIATGGTGFTMGTEPGAGGETVTFYRTTTAGVRKGFLRWYVTTGKTQYSNDGTTWVNNDDSASSVLIKNSATDTTPGYNEDKNVAGDGITRTQVNGGGNENSTWSVNASALVSGDNGLEASGNDLRVKLGTDPGLEFDTGLKAKVKAGGGITRDSDGLSITNAIYPSTTGIAHEAISQGQAICELPMEVQYYTGLTDADLDLGDANSRRRYAVSLVPKENASLTGTWINRIRGKKFGTGQDLVLRVETDNGGEPSGTLVDANATATVTAASFATSHSDETVTWGGSFSLTKGTQYWLVFQVASTDGTNYLSLSVNSSHDENYLAFERLTYDLDLATWGNSVTNACPWFWNSGGIISLGFGLVPCDADAGNRTWNFVGIADNAYSAEADVTYYHEVVPVDDLGLSLTAGLNHYISTSGNLTTTITAYDFDDEANLTYNYRIGKTFKDANGATILKIAPANKKMYMYVESGSTDESHVIQTWFNNPMIRVVVAAGSGTSLGMGIGFGSSSTEMAGAAEGVAFQSDTIYGITSGDNIRISSVTDKTATIIVDETGAATIKALIELEQIYTTNIN